MKTIRRLSALLFVITNYCLLNISSAQNISAAESNSFSICNDNSVRAWGYNSDGELGNGVFSLNSSIPMQVNSLTNVKAISSGQYFTIALKYDSTVWAWGYNSNGQLGNGTTANSNIPVQVTGLSGIISIVAGRSHALALRSDSTVWGWGYNYYGQLGNGSTINSSVPVQSTACNHIIAIATGENHTIALRNTGLGDTLWTWGSNSAGELGNGTTTNSSTPSAIIGPDSIVRIEAGSSTSFVIRDNGTVWAWGWNYYGQLGNGNTTDVHSPIQINALTGITAVSAGQEHAIALKNDGTVLTMGYNYYGELGNGTNIDSSIPLQANALTGITHIVAGSEHSMAVDNSGALYTWGRNSLGQLGNGTLVSSNFPIQVTGICQLSVGINNYIELSAISIYPNPSSNKITVSSNEGIRSMQIFNVLGEVIYSLQNSTEQKSIEVDLSKNPSGIYIVTVQTENKIINRRLIIQQ